jgi:hypothetical protein
MGGRLTEFDQYEMLDGWGTPRPVYGPKHSAVPIGSHLPNDQPRLSQQVINVGPNGVEIALDWSIGNESKHNLNADYRIRLVRTFRFRNDEEWFEYHPNKRVVKDIVSEKTGRAHKIITKHGGSVSTSAKLISIPGGRKTTMPIGITIPGPAQGRDMKKFWERDDKYTFNLLVAVYQRVVGGAEELEKGEHEFKDILELRYDPSALPTRTLTPQTPYTGPKAYELPAEAGYTTRPKVYQGPTTELPAIWYRPTTEIPAWAQEHWDDPNREKVPTRRSKFGDVTVQTYDPDTGDPW